MPDDLAGLRFALDAAGDLAGIWEASGAEGRHALAGALFPEGLAVRAGEIVEPRPGPLLSAFTAPIEAVANVLGRVTAPKDAGGVSGVVEPSDRTRGCDLTGVKKGENQRPQPLERGRGLGMWRCRESNPGPNGATVQASTGIVSKLRVFALPTWPTDRLPGERRLIGSHSVRSAGAIGANPF